MKLRSLLFSLRQLLLLRVRLLLKRHQMHKRYFYLLEWHLLLYNFHQKKRNLKAGLSIKSTCDLNTIYLV